MAGSKDPVRDLCFPPSFMFCWVSVYQFAGIL